MRVFLFLGLIITSFVATGCGSMQPKDPNVPTTTAAYIENKGSDTIVNLALAWAERYQQIRPDVRISVTGGGSGTGITALINGSIPLANASRQITQQELETAKKNGLDPQEFIIARDAIAIIVNPENPVDHLTLQQLSSIYRGEINNWKELGGEDRPIVRLSRETNSGTHVFFLETVIRMGDKKDKTIFTPDTLLLPSSEGIISEVRENPNALGYDGLGYVIPEVKLVSISSSGNPNAFVLPSAVTVADGSYVLSRNLYMYTQNPPTGELQKYLDWIISPEAQQIVTELGFVPVVGSAGAAK
jgi:phosphate transport system substrate-binding protein